MEAPYIDFHTHRQRQDEKTMEVISQHGSKFNAANYYTIGFHPWWTLKKLNLDEYALLKEKYQNDSHCLGIGECGLDKLKGATYEIQEQIFIQHIELANELGAPLIVHCVRQYDQMLRLHRNLAKTDWAIHGYVRNQILARSIIDQGIYLSLAPSNQMKNSFIETLKWVPIDRIFLETDSETSHDIFERYRIFSVLRIDLNGDELFLRQQLFSNFQKFFNKKWQYLNG
jgi:TatD DNase family protein